MRISVRAVATVIVGLSLAKAAWAAPLEGPSRLSPRQRPVLTPDHPVLCVDHPAVCVHARTLAQASLIPSYLRALRQAAHKLHFVLDWPAPMPDHDLGSNAAFDVYLDGTDPFAVFADTSFDWEGLDRTSAFAVVSPSLPKGCMQDAAMAEIYARAGLYNVDAGENHALANASAAYIASIVAPCEPMIWSAVDDYQANPQRAVSSPLSDRGALLFPWFLQSRYGVGASVDLIRALWALAPQQSPSNLLWYRNEPDWIDIVGSVMARRGSSMSDALLEYSIARAFMGSRDDGQHLPTTRYLGDGARVRYERRLAYRDLPISMLSRDPIEPTGALYVWLDLEGAPKDAGIGMRAQWESPAVFRFAIVHLGPDGAEIKRHTPITPERGSSIDYNVETFEGASAAIIVGVNLGALAGPFRFDPDEMPYEPQSYLLSLVAQ